MNKMHEIHNCSGIELTVSARENGELEAAYVQLSSGKVAHTKEIIKSVFLLDFDEDNNVVGLEILAPVKISTVMAVAENWEGPQKDAFNEFIKKYAPPAILQTA